MLQWVFTQLAETTQIQSRHVLTRRTIVIHAPQIKRQSEQSKTTLNRMRQGSATDSETLG